MWQISQNSPFKREFPRKPNIANLVGLSIQEVFSLGSLFRKYPGTHHFGENLSQRASYGKSHVTIHVGGNLYQRAPCGKSRITVHFQENFTREPHVTCSFREEICTREPHVGNLMLLFIQGEICSGEPHVVKSSFVHCLRLSPGTTADQQGVTIFKMKILYVNVIFLTSTTQCEYIK